MADAAARHEAATGAPANRSKEAKNLLQVITQAFDFAVNEQWLTSNPFRGIGVDVPRDQRKKYLSKKDTYEPLSIAESTTFSRCRFSSVAPMTETDATRQVRTLSGAIAIGLRSSRYGPACE
ncbi:hypothetical protein ASD99_22920 [Mesorhizobium sp. Root695]|nr:hypothetical protein ASD99_22920 [Mesorhizobium sp. Root695]